MFLKKSRASAILIGRFFLTNLLLPAAAVYLGYELYTLWFGKEQPAKPL
jgi:hypothetical protein